MDIRRLASSSAFGIAFVVSIVACSGADSTGGAIGGSSPSKDTSATTPSKSGSTSSTGGSSTGSSDNTGASSSNGTDADGGPTSAGTGDDSACGAKTSANDCFDCCFANHQKGGDVGENAYDDCICGANGACATQCASSYCSQNGPDPQQGDACDTCLNGQAAQQCEQKADTACQADADCKAFDTCVTNAKCEDKQ